MNFALVLNTFGDYKINEKYDKLKTVDKESLILKK